MHKIRVINMHKIRVIKLKDPNDVGVINLTKAFAVRKKTSTDEKESVALAVYFPGAPTKMVFPQSSFKFEFVEIAMDGCPSPRFSYLEDYVQDPSNGLRRAGITGLGTAGATPIT